MNGDAISTIKKIDHRYVIERAGKEFVLYAGLLHLAHRSGLKATGRSSSRRRPRSTPGRPLLGPK